MFMPNLNSKKKPTVRQVSNRGAKLEMGDKKMKVRLTKPEEIEIFHKLVADMKDCPNCGRIGKVTDIDPDVYCLSTEFKYGYVEAVCQNCGDVQVVLPMYDAFPSCVEAFEAADSTADTDKIPSKLGSDVVENLRKTLKEEKKSNGKSKQDYRNFL